MGRRFVSFILFFFLSCQSKKNFSWCKLEICKLWPAYIFFRGSPWSWRPWYCKRPYFIFRRFPNKVFLFYYLYYTLFIIHAFLSFFWTFPLFPFILYLWYYIVICTLGFYYYFSWTPWNSSSFVNLFPFHTCLVFCSFLDLIFLLLYLTDHSCGEIYIVTEFFTVLFLFRPVS